MTSVAPEDYERGEEVDELELPVKKATKRKKAIKEENELEDDSNGKRKRIKTPRACDSCRRKKIRFVFNQKLILRHFSD